MRKHCGNCAVYDRKNMKHSKLCGKCVTKHFPNGKESDPSMWKPLPQSNADRIRAMSDEELVDWAKIQIGCGFGFFPCGVVCDGKCEAYDDETCKSKIMEWLKRPAEGE